MALRINRGTDQAEEEAMVTREGRRAERTLEARRPNLTHSSYNNIMVILP